ncbi:MAG: ABC transporter permease [Lachnospiraceae bacterium]|nr:ABC transporter permease [Lachnospiraceae bacterium]
MKTLQLEFYKIKRRKVWLTMFALLSVQLLWGLWAFRNPKDWELESGWLSLLHLLSLLDGIMVPTMMSVLASRLADIEHKGNTYKQLETLRSAGSLYHAKAVCGSMIIMLMFAAQFAFFILLGYHLGYEGNPDVKYYLLSYGLKVASNISLFLLQLALSMVFANQMIPLVAGLGGSMAALLLMFVSTYSFLPWGGNLSASLVRSEWDEVSRISTYCYRTFSPLETAAVVCIFVWIAVFYAAGRILFTRREV